MTSRRAQLAALAATYLLLGALFAIVTPIGEGPDEPAHLAYIDHLLEKGDLPQAPSRYGVANYEWHQPPLDYFASSIVLRLLGADRAGLTFVPNGSFDFRRPGSRAFVPASGESVQELRALRIVRLGWGLITLFACLSIADSLAIDPRARWMMSAYVLAPQLLFISAVINNDASVIAFSSLTLLMLIWFAETPRVSLGIGVGICLLAALFAKASGVFLIVAVIVAATVAPKRFPALAALLGSSTVALLLWWFFNVRRFGSVFPSVPAAGRAALPIELVSDPRWTGGLFRSFWAKFGWLNTPMPSAFYVWFALLSVAVVIGAVALVRRGEPRRCGLILVSALLANVLLLLAFLVRVDLQPQGRYLFPSLGAISTCGVVGLEVMLRRVNNKVAYAIAAIAVAVATAGAVTIARAYA